MYVCCKKDLRFSTAAIGNSTNHTAPAVMASLLPLLKELEMSRIKHVNLISDSPNSQYCNKGMFWFLKTLCEEFNITVKYVYLESSYVKGIPDGIGAKVKKNHGESHAFKSIGTNVICWGFVEKWPTRGCLFHWPIYLQRRRYYKVQKFLPKTEANERNNKTSRDWIHTTTARNYLNDKGQINRCYCLEGFIGARLR